VRENVRIAEKTVAKLVSGPPSAVPEFPRLLPRILQRYSQHSPTWPPAADRYWIRRTIDEALVDCTKFIGAEVRRLFDRQSRGRPQLEGLGK
jgi:hypothetical protein